MALIRLSAVSLEYFEQGSGPQTVVLVHGYQSSGRICWRVTAPPVKRSMAGMC